MNSQNSLLELCLLRFCINSTGVIFSWFSSLFSLFHGARPKAFGCWAVVAFQAGNVAIPITHRAGPRFPVGRTPRNPGTCPKKLGTSGFEVPRVLVLLNAVLRAYFALTLATAGLSRTAWGASRFLVGGVHGVVRPAVPAMPESMTRRSMVWDQVVLEGIFNSPSVLES